MKAILINQQIIKIIIIGIGLEIKLIGNSYEMTPQKLLKYYYFKLINWYVSSVYFSFHSN